MEELTFPLYFKCTSKAQFETLNASAAVLIDSDSYQQPLIDKYNQYWFIVNSEVQNLVDLNQCTGFESIEFPSEF